MNSKKLNEEIRKLDDIETLPGVVAREKISSSDVGNIRISSGKGAARLDSLLMSAEDTGKKIFYWGWFWREVNFDEPITLAYDTQGLVGFCENNKWDYPMIQLSEESSKRLRELCETAVTEPSKATVTAVNEFMKSHLPKDWKTEAEMADEEIRRMLEQ